MLASKLPSASRRVMDKEEQLGAITHLSTTGVEAQVKLVPDRLVNSIGTVGMGVGATLGAIVGTAVGGGMGDAVGRGVGLKDGEVVGSKVGRGVGASVERQLNCPVLIWNWPEGQGEHLVAAEAEEYLPASQLVQATDPVEAENCPPGQLPHADCPVLIWNVPAAQFSHAD